MKQCEVVLGSTSFEWDVPAVQPPTATGVLVVAAGAEHAGRHAFAEP